MDLLWDLAMIKRQRDPSAQQHSPILISLGLSLTDIGYLGVGRFLVILLGEVRLGRISRSFLPRIRRSALNWPQAKRLD
jgi:hypothetical protein